jgi:HSP20 family protein
MLWNTAIFNDLDDMRKDMDALSEMLGYTGAYQTSFPRINAYEDKDGYTLAVDVPGIPRKDLDMRCDEGTLTLFGSRGKLEQSHARRVLRQEREAGSFEKIFRFPAKVDSARVSARLENGILLVKVPKAEEAKPKPIAISVGDAKKGA